MTLIGSYTGDYLHLIDEKLAERLTEAEQAGPEVSSLSRQVIQDIKQVQSWRQNKDSRGWPSKK